MRRIYLATLFTFLLLAALLPFHRTNRVGAAASEGERLSMYCKPAVVKLWVGSYGSFYYSLLIQSSPEPVTEAKDQSGGISSTWLVVGVLVVLFLLVAVIVIAVVVFLLMRRRSMAQPALRPATGLASSPLAASPAGGLPKSEAATPAPPAYQPTPAPKPSLPSDSPAPRTEPVVAGENAMTVDLSRTVAISADGDTSAISYGSIKFISGVLAGEQFELKPEGSCIGRDSTLSQIVIADPRISKRHVWIGVRDGRVVIIDQDSRNGTFVNDPKSPRVREVALKPGDTVILGESDVARFEYQT